jgi:hypothetical protein
LRQCHQVNKKHDFWLGKSFGNARLILADIFSSVFLRNPKVQFSWILCPDLGHQYADCQLSQITKQFGPLSMMRLVSPGSLQSSLNRSSGQIELARFKMGLWGYNYSFWSKWIINQLINGGHNPVGSAVFWVRAAFALEFLDAYLVDTQHGLSYCLDIHLDYPALRR